MRNCHFDQREKSFCCSKNCGGCCQKDFSLCFEMTTSKPAVNFEIELNVYGFQRAALLAILLVAFACQLFVLRIGVHHFEDAVEGRK
jgi:hypothetical protein